MKKKKEEKSLVESVASWKLADFFINYSFRSENTQDVFNLWKESGRQQKQNKTKQFISVLFYNTVKDHFLKVLLYWFY